MITELIYIGSVALKSITSVDRDHLYDNLLYLLPLCINMGS
jgi:hypothetical protein